MWAFSKFKALLFKEADLRKASHNQKATSYASGDECRIFVEEVDGLLLLSFLPPGESSFG